MSSLLCVCVCVQASSAVVPLQLDASGKVKYDVLARMGQRKDKVRLHYLTQCVYISGFFLYCV